jgi:hypothetical protein
MPDEKLCPCSLLKKRKRRYFFDDVREHGENIVDILVGLRLPRENLRRPSDSSFPLCLSFESKTAATSSELYISYTAMADDNQLQGGSILLSIGL